MINAKLRPQMSFAPMLLSIIEKPGNDPLAKAIVKSLGNHSATLKTKWKSLPNDKKINKYFIRQPQPWLTTSSSMDLKSRIVSFAAAYNASRKQLIEARKKVIISEYKKYLKDGVGKYVPSTEFLRDRILAAEFQRYLAAKFGTNGCRCEKPDDSTPVVPPKPKYGLFTTKLKCFDQCESGHDEIYLICVAVDGNGQYIKTVSEKYSIDDDDDDVLYPKHWIYPTKDPNGFLDVAVRMMEDDGGYDEISDPLKAAGGVVSAIGSAIGNPIVIGAGVAIEIIGSIIDIIGDLDDDENYGLHTKTWTSATSLQSAVGSYVFPYTGEDWAGDDYDFDLTVKLEAY